MAVASFSELLSEQEWTALKEMLGLSPQQARIVRYLLQAKPDKQIAKEMGISVPTVRTYLCRLFHKLDVNDRVELVLRVFAFVRAGDVHDSSAWHAGNHRTGRVLRGHERPGKPAAEQHVRAVSTDY